MNQSVVSYQTNMLLKRVNESLLNIDITKAEEYSKSFRRFKYQKHIYLQRILNNFNNTVSDIGDIVKFKQLISPIGSTYLQFKDSNDNIHLIAEFDILVFYTEYQGAMVEIADEDVLYINPYIKEQYIYSYIDTENCSIYEIDKTITNEYGHNKLKTRWTYSYPIDTVYGLNQYGSQILIDDVSKWKVEDNKSVLKISNYAKIQYLVDKANSKEITPNELLSGINYIENKNI